MKTICQKSGVVLHKSDLLLGFDLADEHPIFRAKSTILFGVPMTHRFMFAENPDEKKLIFLAYLNATYLVDFQHHASPTLKTMEKNFYRLQEMAQWVRYAEFKLAKIVAFPRYVIRSDNSDLSNIGSWLNSLGELREKINRRELERDKSAALQQREMEIKRELGEANFAGKAFTPKLAKWSLDVCDITLQHADYNKWMKIMCIPLNEAWMIDLAEYYELQQLLQEHLPVLESNPQAISVMHQINTLIKECRKGFTDFSMLSNVEGEEVSDFEILEDGQQVQRFHKVNQHMKDVPTEEPKKENYTTKLAFLLAKAKWDLSKNKPTIVPPPKPTPEIDEDSV